MTNPTNFSVEFPLRLKIALGMEGPAVQRPLMLLLLFQFGLICYAVVDGGPLGEHAMLMEAARFILYAFAIELLLRVYAQGGRFFSSFWNVLDAVVIIVALYPPFIMISLLRLIRLMRAMRLIPQLSFQPIFSAAFFSALPNILAAALILFIVYFTYGLMGFHMFKDIDPANYGVFDASMFTTARVMIEGWPTDIIRDIALENSLAYVYFVTLYLLCNTIVIAGLVIIISSMINEFLKHYSYEVIRDTQNTKATKRLDKEGM